MTLHNTIKQQLTPTEPHNFMKWMIQITYSESLFSRNSQIFYIHSYFYIAILQMILCTVMKIEAVCVHVFVEVSTKTKCGVYRQQQGPCTSLLSSYSGCKLQSNPRPATYFTQTRTSTELFFCFFLFIQISQVCPAGTISGLSHSYSAV